MADLEVDTTQLAKDGDEFNNVAAVAYSIYGSLARATALMTFPDDDPVSKMFSDQWNSLVSGVQAMMQGFHDGMSGVADGVLRTAALYRQSNEASEESVIPPPTVLE
jgi:hypothetical protein